MLGRDNFARGAMKGWIFRKRRWRCQERNNGIRDISLKEQLCLQSKMKLYEIVKWMLKMEIRK
jgi:hypothetical protein